MKTPNILSLVPGSQGLALKALAGTRLICQTQKTFESFVDKDFINWSLNKPGAPTPETKIQVHEMVANGTFMDIFRSLPGTWNQKWLSQDQIIEFCETLPQWLRQEGYVTFFLIKKDENRPINERKLKDNLVVVDVYVNSDGLRVYVDQLESGGVWGAEDRLRVVSPQPMSLGD